MKVREFIKQTKKLYFPTFSSKVSFLVGVLVRENEWAIRESEELNQFLNSLFANTNTILTKTVLRRMVDVLIRLKRKTGDFQTTMLNYIIKAILLMKDWDRHFMKLETGYFLSGYMLGLHDFYKFLKQINNEEREQDKFLSEQEKALKKFLSSKKNFLR
jgi:hypothetical protein